MTPKNSQKYRAWLKGKRAENLACLWLILTGHRIVARRLRVARTEIDILARRWFSNRALIIVEVKARENMDEAILALGSRQLDRLQQAALWLYSQGYMKNNDNLRIDLIAICPWRIPKHFRNITL